VHQIAQAIDEDGVLEVQSSGAEQVAVERIWLAMELAVTGHGSRQMGSV
jgi:hypothetical protein